MARKTTHGDNFRVDTSPGSQSHANLLRGEVSGVIDVEPPAEEPMSPEHQALAQVLAVIEAEESKEDSLIAALFVDIKDENPERRIARLAEEVNKVRHAQKLPKERNAHLSRFANRLRELM